jgi:NADP-dependent 3-hydroxy acid dehydrogenase YdfG
MLSRMLNTFLKFHGQRSWNGVRARWTGMGLARAKRFVEEGMAQVFITGRRQDALDRVVAEIGRNVTATEIHMSVSSRTLITPAVPKSAF